MKNLLYLLIILFITGLTACSGYHKHPSEHIKQQVYSLWEEGRRHEKEERIKDALICYWNALDLLQTEQDSILKARTYNRLGDLLFSYGLYEKAVENHREGYNLAQRLTNQTLLCETTRKLTLDYTLLNQNDTAQYFLELSNRIARENNLPALLLPDEKELKHITSSLKADSIGDLYDREQLLNWEARYKHQKAQLQAEQLTNRKLQQLSVFLGTVLILLSLLFFMYRKKKEEERKREKQLLWFKRILEDNRSKLEEYQTELFTNHRRIEELQQSLHDNRVSSEENRSLREELNYYLQQENRMKMQEEELRKREKALLSDESAEVVALLNRMKNSPTYQPIQNKTEWELLENFTEILYPGYAGELAQARELTERDIELCYLVKLGFTTRQLAIFYGISPGSITKAKFRLQKKLDTSGNNEPAETSAGRA